MKNVILLVNLLLLHSIGFSQSNLNIWGEAHAESVIGASANVKHNKWLYSFGYNQYVNLFEIGTSEFEISRIEFDVHRVNPIIEDRLDVTYGAGIGYGFGEQHIYLGDDWPALEYNIYDTLNYNSIMGNVGFKVNYYPTKNIGIGTGGRIVVGEDYNAVFPQFRLLFGLLRE